MRVTGRTAMLGVLVAAIPATTSAQTLALRPGLIVNYAHHNFSVPGDQDFYVKVLSADESQVVMTTRFVADDVPRPNRPAAITLLDHVSRRELRGARRFSHGREERNADTTEVRNRTVMTLSSRVLSDLKANGEATFTQFYWINDPTALFPIDGEFRVVGKEAFPLWVDGTQRNLPAIHIRGRAEQVAMNVVWEQDLWFLDDSSAAWLLRDETKMVGKGKGLEFHLRMTSAATSEAEGAKLLDALERKLRDDCRVASYGFYFATASADLSPASDTTFAVVAAMLRRHPDWRVTIEGHTDSIGGAQANKDLSERRAAAVRTRLVSAYRVPATQLSSAGFGLSKPVAPNTTLEGRAQNRRVELTRVCPGRS